MTRSVLVPFERWAGWVERFDRRHPGAAWCVTAAELSVESPDGTSARVDVPFPPLAEPSLDGLVRHLALPRAVGILLVRRGGFAVGRLAGPQLAAAKVGRRHVQGRTRAGGWSQQRFARRRDNQARVAFDAAAEHAARVLGSGPLDLLVLGGDRPAVAHVLADPRLAALAGLPQRWLAVSGDPTAETLRQAARTARSLTVLLVDPVQPAR